MGEGGGGRWQCGRTHPEASPRGAALPHPLCRAQARKGWDKALCTCDSSNQKPAQTSSFSSFSVPHCHPSGSAPGPRATEGSLPGRPRVRGSRPQTRQSSDPGLSCVKHNQPSQLPHAFRHIIWHVKISEHKIRREACSRIYIVSCSS